MAKAVQEVLVRYGEIFLKSPFVFRQFEKKLVENVARVFKRRGVKFKIRKERGRIFVEAPVSEARELQNVFGVVSFSPVWRLGSVKLKDIKNFCKDKFKGFVKKGETFAVRAKRVGNHNFSSKDLEVEVGKVVRGKVDLSRPQKEIFVEVRENEAYIFTEVFQGPGGLPVSSSGKVVSFISGGIDSAVSSWLAMKRGCQVVFLHFHSFPLVSQKSIEKTKTIVEKLNDYQFNGKLILIPFQKVQQLLKLGAPAKYLVVLYRRSMVRVGQNLAEEEKAKALFTGESLGQVSSQTLPNLAVIDEAAKLPVFRPLIGMDKAEIIDIARKIGTFETSILPQEDCCQLFVPKHPATQANVALIKDIEKKVGVQKLEREILKEKREIFV
ncbi:MAG: thiamine biosynthesis protein ThiI [Parcubacteria group bacterium Gr01-1014_30]|nr:MAG: thiamine biosynthesis protein ThiI [Parcubacteria group bacterium Gr01-1014_30]